MPKQDVDKKAQRLNLAFTVAFRKILDSFQRKINAASLTEAVRRAVLFADRCAEPNVSVFVRRPDGTETEVVL